MDTVTLDSLYQGYRQKTGKSARFMNEAKNFMPGGVTANIKWFSPHPIVMKKGSGAYLTDLDGNVYIDYLLANGALMLGHGHPAIINAITDQLHSEGTSIFGTPHHREVEMAKKIQHYYPSIEILRYTNSGTEATLLALRLAEAYTGKHLIAKFEGHYHGGYNHVLLSVNPSLEEAGPADSPDAVIESKGIDSYYKNHTLVLPFNHIEACTELITRHKDELAAIIMEPVQTGFIPADPSFMRQLRQLTEDLGILLIFDEVKTGFRIGLGGAQSFYHVKPDLTTLGKVVGGGFPVGIVGGKKDILTVSMPNESFASREILFHSGTYNGHPTILTAGLKTIETLEADNNQVLKTTETLKNGIESLFAEKGLPMKAVGLGSIFNVVLTDKDQITNYRELQQSDLKTRKKLDYLLLIQGIYTKPLNRYNLSIVHRQKEVDRTLEAYKHALSML